MLATQNAQRILDHRAFLSAEIEGFCEGFEKKRNDTEVQSLFTIITKIGAIEESIEKIKVNNTKETFTEFLGEANDVLEKIEKALEAKNLEHQPNESTLQSRADRDKRKTELFDSIEHSKERIKNSLDEKKEEIDEFYADLQIRLNIVS